MTFGVTEWEMTRHAVTSVSNTRAGGRDTISQSEAGSDHDWPIRGKEDDRSLADMPTGSVTIVTGSVTIMWRYFVSRHFLVFSFSVKPGLSVATCVRHIVSARVWSWEYFWWLQILTLNICALWPGQWAGSVMVLGLMMQLMYDSSWQPSYWPAPGYCLMIERPHI